MSYYNGGWNWRSGNSSRSSSSNKKKGNSGYYSIWDDYDDKDDDNSSSSGSSNHSGRNWNSYFNYTEKADQRACIENGYGFSNHQLEKYMDLYDLKKGKDVLNIIKSSEFEYMVKDIFYLYKVENRKFNITDENKDWYDMLVEFDNYILRQFTVDNNDYSYIITGFIINNVLSLMFDPTGQDPNKNNKDPLNNNVTKDQIKDAFQNALDKAQEAQNDLDTIKEELGIGNEAGSKMEDIKVFMDRNILSSMANIRKFFKKLFGKSGSIKVDSSDYIVNIEDIEHVEDFTDFVSVESLATEFPVFDVFTKRSSKIMFDIYVDVSGSMNASDIKIGEKNFTRSSIAKMIAIKMKSLGLLNNVYTFDTRVREVEHPNKISFTGGGTDPDACVRHRKDNKIDNKIKYLILTDGDCFNYSYDENLTMMSIAKHSYIESYVEGYKKNPSQYSDKSYEPFIRYCKEKKYLFYDGKRISSLLEDENK